jgi:hypothetical protein
LVEEALVPQLLPHLPLVEVSELHQRHQHLVLQHLLLQPLEAVGALELHPHLVGSEQHLIQVHLERRQLLLPVVECLARQLLPPVVECLEALLILAVSELRAPQALVEVDSVPRHPHPLVEIQEEEPLELQQRHPLAVFLAVQHLQLHQRLEPLVHLAPQPLRLVEVCLELLHQRQEVCLVPLLQLLAKAEDPRWFRLPSQLVKTATRLPIFLSNPLLQCSLMRTNHSKN